MNDVKTFAGIAVLALGILAASFAARAGRSAPAAAAPSPADPKPDSEPRAVPADRLPDTPEPKARPAAAPTPLLRRVFSLLSGARERIAWHRSTGQPFTEAELAEVNSMERQAQELGRELARELELHPDTGTPVIEGLLAYADEAVVLRIVEMIARSLDPAARGRLAGSLQGTGSLRERRIACLVLSTDSSSAAVTPLLNAAQSDVDASVRRAAFQALAWGLGTADARDAALVREVAATRATADPDQAVRRVASTVARPPAATSGRAQAAARRAR